MKDGGLWILRVHSNGDAWYLIGDKGFDEQESDFVHDEKMAIGNWVMSWPKIYGLFQQILSIANPICGLFQQMDSSNVCYSRHCHRVCMNRNMCAVVMEWSGMVRNVFRNIQECENKSQMRWHNPSGYYHQACQECQEHFQECSGMWEKRVLAERVRNVRNVFRNIFRNAAVTVPVLPLMLFCHQSRDLSKNMVEWCWSCSSESDYCWNNPQFRRLLSAGTVCCNTPNLACVVSIVHRNHPCTSHSFRILLLLEQSAIIPCLTNR